MANQRGRYYSRSVPSSPIQLPPITSASAPNSPLLSISDVVQGTTTIDEIRRQQIGQGARTIPEDDNEGGEDVEAIDTAFLC